MEYSFFSMMEEEFVIVPHICLISAKVYCFWMKLSHVGESEVEQDAVQVIQSLCCCRLTFHKPSGPRVISSKSCVGFLSCLCLWLLVL